jgi:CubicO group peptidase (beta-lactamase class C family)
MHPIISAALGAALLALAPPAAAQAPDPRPARVDSIFASIDGTSSPGCACTVVQNGKPLHRRGYGMADLERRVPIGPETVFYTGSVSKQFTAMSVALLARDGRLSLDDPARKHLPEIPEAGAGITIRHMVHHTSGLREKWDLLMLGGFREGNLVTQADVLDLVERQRELNFAPGDDFLYNNTAYDLLATVVERVSGTSIREFAAERIFGPLGMTRSRYSDDRSVLIPDRALGYSVDRNGVRHDPAWVETVGSGSVYSTVDDLAKWDESFYTAALGDQALVELVQTPGRLNDGTALDYAFGLMVDRWRGVRRVQHGGALAGYRAQITRFPDQHLSVIVLCNYAQANPGTFANRVAEVYLANTLAPARAGASTAAAAFGNPALASRAAGVYRSTRAGNPVRLVPRADSLILDLGFGRMPLRADGEAGATFRLGDETGVVRFEGTAGAPVARLVIEGLGLRPETYERAEPPATTAAALAPLAGRYYSPELDRTWIVAVRDTTITIENGRGPVAARPVFRDGFQAQGSVVAFERDRRGRPVAFRVTPGRSWRIRFERMAER